MVRKVFTNWFDTTTGCTGSLTWDNLGALGTCTAHTNCGVQKNNIASTSEQFARCENDLSAKDSVCRDVVSNGNVGRSVKGLNSRCHELEQHGTKCVLEATAVVKNVDFAAANRYSRYWARSQAKISAICWTEIVFSRSDGMSE
jgi:hypothetical protein